MSWKDCLSNLIFWKKAGPNGLDKGFRDYVTDIEEPVVEVAMTVDHGMVRLHMSFGGPSFIARMRPREFFLMVDKVRREIEEGK